MADEAGTVAGGCWIFLHARTGCVLTLTIFLRIARGMCCLIRSANLSVVCGVARLRQTRQLPRRSFPEI